jgi:hypothetical protein
METTLSTGTQKFKLNEVKRVIKGVTDAGISVGEIRFRPDGSFGIVPGAPKSPEDADEADLDAELAAFEARTRG